MQAGCFGSDPRRKEGIFTVSLLHVLAWGSTLVFATMASTAYATTAIQDAFRPTTPTETLTALFTTTGATTSAEYTGLVAIRVSGFGQGGGTMVNDAFYGFESAPGVPMIPPQPIWTFDPRMGIGSSFLRLSLTGCACSSECSAPSISEFMAFIDGVGPVSPRTIPDFNPQHTYRFVIDVGTRRGRLTLGNYDCGFWDNTGAFTIQVNGVEPVPPDRDGDGIADAEEECSCRDTPVGHIVNAQGCSLQQLCPCEAPLGRTAWKNQKEYVSCVSGAAEEFVAEGLLTKEQQKSIVRQAQRASCGR